VGDPRATYHRFDIQGWRDKISAELQASGLPDAIQKLTKEMVDSARINALLSEADTIIRQLRDLSNVQEYVLSPYVPPSFISVFVDESSLRHGGLRTTTTPQKEATIKRVDNSRPC
jgi:hypothetical protein